MALEEEETGEEEGRKIEREVRSESTLCRGEQLRDAGSGGRDGRAAAPLAEERRVRQRAEEVGEGRRRNAAPESVPGDADVVGDVGASSRGQAGGRSREGAGNLPPSQQRTASEIAAKVRWTKVCQFAGKLRQGFDKYLPRR